MKLESSGSKEKYNFCNVEAQKSIIADIPIT